MDTWISGYSAPLLDESQDISAISGSITNGVTVLEFTRKRSPVDTQDLAFTDDHCLYMMFPVKGGAFNAVNKKTRKHEDVPIVSESRICIKSCGLDSTDYVGPATTPAPNRLAYAVSMKLINLADGFEAPKKGSQEYQDLSQTIQNTFNGVLGDIPGYYKLDEIAFNK
jgi:DOMON domain